MTLTERLRQNADDKTKRMMQYDCESAADALDAKDERIRELERDLAAREEELAEYKGKEAAAPDHATPSGGREAGPEEDRIEAAYWRFDARRSGYGKWQQAPMSERDAFKTEMRNGLAATRCRRSSWRRRRPTTSQR